MQYPGMHPSQVARVLAAARESAMADPSVVYPRWYLRRLHRMPEGYLSAGAPGRYERTIERLYNAFRADYVAQTLANEILDERPATVLEVGCGAGRLLEAIADADRSVAHTGVDLSPFMLEAARRRVADAELIHADIALMDLGRTFDAIAAVHVFEHGPASWGYQAIERAAAHLSPGGTLHVVRHAWHRLRTPPGMLPVSKRRLLGGLLVHQRLGRPIE
jgi:SAM-dependent methyltransferase